MPPERFRVATYNTRDFLDDHHLAARVVRAIDPDLLCLQEVPRRLLAPWRLRRFAARCGMRWSGRQTGSGGTTVLTAPHVELLAASHHRLPVRWPDRTRGWARAHVRLPGGHEVTAVSLHLSLRAPERVRHVAAVLEALRGVEPLVVAGDLNEGPDGEAYRRVGDPGGLAVAGPGTPTYPARAPHRPLDVLFASPGLRVLPAREVALPEAVWAAASDHRPAWVDLEVG
ncbi:MAG: endonuclease/exonuclease/phosphatase family protein [Micrococcales bacterium]|uniref:endonuclease/exonuclease/phosphatase family protein n=1 Tax=Phycicoccus sp. TaxID=1902410 RepID=UPI0019A56A45|nr:endonuclease/exonuclease/phosphatase family protein [Phycicoccus sp.]MBD3784137.1 endonuclease/exonuclease/phosphatase family protein [Micrococcales bacterium]HMM95885.1 endonuclease/exonuclease/phosphatase family protein [Phycicoccus sp.]